MTVRYLGPASSLSIDDIAQESYWSADNTGDITRIFPASGIKSRFKADYDSMHS